MWHLSYCCPLWHTSYASVSSFSLTHICIGMKKCGWLRRQKARFYETQLSVLILSLLTEHYQVPVRPQEAFVSTPKTTFSEWFILTPTQTAHQLICVGRYICTHTHTHMHTIVQAGCVRSLYPVWCSASGPSLAAPPHKLLAVHSVLNAEAL